MTIKFQHIVYVFILGLAVSLLGFYLKIESVTGADTVITAGAVMTVSAAGSCY